jgi:hypothetical protein
LRRAASAIGDSRGRNNRLAKSRRRRQHAEVVLDHRVECFLLFRVELTEKAQIEARPEFATVLEGCAHAV